MTLTRNILTTLSARIATLALAVLSSIVLTRWLGPDGRGLFTLVLLLPGLTINLGLLGFDQANTVYAGLKPDKRPALFWHSVVIALGAGTLLAVAAIGFVAVGAPGFGNLVRGSLWLYAVPLSIVPIRLVAEYASAILRGMNRIVLLSVVEVATRVGAIVLIGVFVVGLGLGVGGAVWMDSVAGVGSAALMLALVASAGAIGRPVFDPALWRQTWRFAIPVYGAALMTFLNYRVDQFMVAAMLPPEQLGFYALAVELTERLWIITGAVATALLPHLTNSPQREPTLVATICRHVLLWTGAAALLLFIVSDPLITILYSPAFSPASAAVRWLLPGVLVLTVGKVLIAELAARERIGFTAWLAGGAALVNVGANVVLIPSMGIAGAALASVVSYSLVSAVVTRHYLRETGLAWTILVPRWRDVLAYRALWRARVGRAAQPLEPITEKVGTAT